VPARGTPRDEAALIVFDLKSEPYVRVEPASGLEPLSREGIEPQPNLLAQNCYLVGSLRFSFGLGGWLFGPYCSQGVPKCPIRPADNCRIEVFLGGSDQFRRILPEGDVTQKSARG
jgi:hypothetical protein